MLSDIDRLLASIEKQSVKDLEVLLVSQIDLPVAVDYNFRLKVLPQQSNGGASAARNYGAKLASSRLFGFLDDDVVLDESWCELAISSFDIPSVGAVSGEASVDLSKYRLDYIPRSLLWVVGGSYWVRASPKSVKAAAGMNFCVRADAFFKAGGFDERLGPFGDRPESKAWTRIGGEESDLAIRIGRCGSEILFNPQMIVVHRLRRESVSLHSLAKRSLHVGRNRAYIHRKYGKYGAANDLSTLRDMLGTSVAIIARLPLHPVSSWKALSFEVFIVAWFVLGYFTSFRSNFGGPGAPTRSS